MCMSTYILYVLFFGLFFSRGLWAEAGAGDRAAGLGAMRPGCQTQLCPSLVVWPWASHLISQSLSFFIRKKVRTFFLRESPNVFLEILLYFKAMRIKEKRVSPYPNIFVKHYSVKN